MDAVIREMRTALADPARPSKIVSGCGILADVLFYSGRIRESQRLIEEMLGPDRQRAVSPLLFLLGRAQVHAGQYAEGAINLERIVGAQREIGLYNLFKDDTVQLLFRAALALGDLPAAERWSRQAHKPNPYSSASGGGNDAVDLALLAIAQDRPVKARGNLAVALQAYANSGDLLAAVPYVFPTASLYFARLGEVERSIELYAAASGHPWVARSVWHQEVIGKPIAEAAATLPSDVARAAEERGQALAWEATVLELLAELGAG
jgi:hypothetical protein